MSAALDIQTERESPALLLIRLRGRLDSTTAPLLELKIKESCADDKELRRVLFVCGDLRYISSAGLSVFLGLVRQLGGAGEVALCDVSPSIHKVMKIAGFTQFINVYDYSDRAIKALNGA